MRQNLKKWLIMILCLIIIIPLSFSGLKSCNSDRKQKKDNTESVSDGNKLPKTYTKLYTLKQGEVVRVFIPTWYKYEISSGDKQFYHQDQNGPKEIWGDGTFHQGSNHTAFFDLYYYNEEITVVVEFKRLR